MVSEMRVSICEDCASSISSGGGERCRMCGKPLISEIEICLPCRNNGESSYNRMWVLFPYTGKYRKLLAAYKFKNNLSLANFFSDEVKKVIRCEDLLKDVVIVPVPPRKGKIKTTGWDQVEHLVKKIESASGIPVDRCLKRRKSKVQKQLDRRERMENMKGNIYLAREAPKNALIIDDVITTGSTMETCAKVLKEAGTERVYGLCLFYD